MPRLRDRLQPTTSPWRDRVGMLCGIGAVASLASLIIHWSQQYPVHRSPWEQQLFGDLAAFDQSLEPASVPARDAHVPPRAAEPGAATRPLSHPPVAEFTQASTSKVFSPITASEDSGRDQPILVEVTPSPMPALRSSPIASWPEVQHPRFIQPVTHEQTATGRSVWLSGAIEVETAEERSHRQAQQAGDLRDN